MSFSDINGAFPTRAAAVAGPSLLGHPSPLSPQHYRAKVDLLFVRDVPKLVGTTMYKIIYYVCFFHLSATL